MCEVDHAWRPSPHEDDPNHHGHRIFTHILIMSLHVFTIVMSCLFKEMMLLRSAHRIYQQIIVSIIPMCFAAFSFSNLWYFNGSLWTTTRKPPGVESATAPVASQFPSCRKVDISVRLIQSHTVWMLSLRKHQTNCWGKDVFKPLSIRLSVLLFFDDTFDALTGTPQIYSDQSRQGPKKRSEDELP